MRTLVFGVLVCVSSAIVFGQQPSTPETPHIEFITQYIHQLGEIQSIRDVGRKDLSEAKDDASKTVAAIHFCAAMRIQLRSEMNTFRNMTLNSPYDVAIPFLLRSAQDKSDDL